MEFHVVDGHMKYIPPIHSGTRDEVIMAFAKEAEEITHSGAMRLHAQGRELDRIAKQLHNLGADLLIGTAEDEGYTLIVGQHLPECELAATGLCNCRPVYRFKGHL